MEPNLEPPTSDSTTPTNEVVSLLDRFDDDSNSSTPFVSAPSSPGHRATTTFLSPPPPGFFFYSAPTSPVHFVLCSTATARASEAPPSYDASSSGSFEFEFSSRFDSPAAPEIVTGMSSADELFLNGQIRPMKLCAHLSHPQYHDIIEGDEEEDDDVNDVVSERSRDSKLRNRSQRRRTRSMSPLRNTTPFDWILTSDDVIATPEKAEQEREIDAGKGDFTTPASGGSSRCSSTGRSSKRWVFLKDFLRSKSEGRSNNKFWQNINMSFSAAAKEKEKKPGSGTTAAPAKKTAAKKRRSAHEMHYAANRAQAEEMRKKTFLPYRQGLLGCLGFNSKSYGALNGFARALNPVSSR